jgi:hypothetical protein
MKRGISWKVVTLYGLITTLNAFYDAGMYLSFFVHGPNFIRKILELDQTESFSAIQARLFVRWCASQEIKKAT